MVEFVGLHGWSLVLFFSVVLAWCVLGWSRLVTSRSPEEEKRPSAAPWPGAWQEDVRGVDGQEALDRLCDRWRGRVPGRERR